jgi:hypothetical protein
MKKNFPQIQYQQHPPFQFQEQNQQQARIELNQQQYRTHIQQQLNQYQHQPNI